MKIYDEDGDPIGEISLSECGQKAIVGGEQIVLLPIIREGQMVGFNAELEPRHSAGTYLYVEKRYIRRTNGDIKTLTGSLATDDPEKDKKAMDDRLLSSIDPRIQWDEEFDVTGWDYEDWSFGFITKEEADERGFVVD